MPFPLVVTPEIAPRLEPLRDKPAGMLLVHEVYRSIQGESTYAGLPCVFVRLTACHARCHWCDTPHAFKEGHLRSLDSVRDEVLALDCPLVELTGGEPLLQAEALVLMSQLADAGKTVLVETSGTCSIAGVDPRVRIIMDLKCPDSGECANNRWDNLPLLKPTDEIKFVIASRRDWDWAEATIREHRLTERFRVLVGGVYGELQPVHLVDWLLESRLNARYQLQLHKSVWPAAQRGV